MYDKIFTEKLDYLKDEYVKKVQEYENLINNIDKLKEQLNFIINRLYLGR